MPNTYNQHKRFQEQVIHIQIICMHSFHAYAFKRRSLPKRTLKCRKNISNMKSRFICSIRLSIHETVLNASQFNLEEKMMMSDIQNLNTEVIDIQVSILLVLFLGSKSRFDICQGKNRSLYFCLLHNRIYLKCGKKIKNK